MTQGNCMSTRGSSMFKCPEAERSSSSSPLALLGRASFLALTPSRLPREETLTPKRMGGYQIQGDRCSGMGLELRQGCPLFPFGLGSPEALHRMDPSPGPSTGCKIRPERGLQWGVKDRERENHVEQERFQDPQIIIGQGGEAPSSA